MQLVINLLKILCTNAAWQRRKLGKMLQDWRVTYVQVCPLLVFQSILLTTPPLSLNYAVKSA